MDAVLDRLAAQYLNGVLPVPPTVEMMACWILAKLPAYREFVIIRAYGGFECRVVRADIALD